MARNLEEYARRAKDMQLIRHATEIRMNAVRCLGLLLEEQKNSGARAKPGKPPNGSSDDPLHPIDPITLSEAGIDKHLADKARKFARTDDEFERFVEPWFTVERRWIQYSSAPLTTH